MDKNVHEKYVMITHGAIKLGYAHYHCVNAVLSSFEYLTDIPHEALTVWSLRELTAAKLPADYDDVSCHIKHQDEKDEES